jgi:hypothetical protein
MSGAPTVPGGALDAATREAGESRARLIAAVVAGALGLGTAAATGAAAETVPATAPGASLAIGLLLAGIAMKRARGAVARTAAVVARLLVSAGAAATLGAAVAAERQNYWEAADFAVIVWVGALAAVQAAWDSLRGELRAAEPLRAIALAIATLWAIAFATMLSPSVRDAEAAIARWLWLLTHG